jgi:LPS sulfotransferase NodH
MIKLLYIVGSSYSGSTLLGILLGKNKGCFNAGELKALGRATAANEICSCRKNISNCSFWSELLPLVDGTTSQPRIADWFSTTISLFYVSQSKLRQSSDDYALIAAIAQKAFNQQDGGLIIDVSKSLWRLDRLLKDPGLSIKTIWIRKTLPASIVSLTKRGRGFWSAAMQALLTDWVNRRFLRKHTPDYSTIWYERLATDPNAALAKLCEDIGIDREYANRGIRPFNELHLATGNKNTKLGLSSDQEIAVKLDPSWLRELTSTQRRFAVYLARRSGQPIETYFNSV